VLDAGEVADRRRGEDPLGGVEPQQVDLAKL
jgi:hypothetical protein